MKNIRLRRKFLFLAFAVLTVILIAIISIEYFRIRNQMRYAADLLDKMSTAEFMVDADITDTIPINTSFKINSSIPVVVDMMITSSMPLQMNVNVEQTLKVPVEMDINRIIPVDTLFEFPDGINGRLIDTFPINDKMRATLLGIKVPIKIKGTLPIDKNLRIQSEGIRGRANIPIHIPINDSIAITLNMTIPVQDTIPLHLPIKAQAQISFISTLPVEGRIPIHIRKQIPVSLKKTALNIYFKELGKTLRELLR